jgi:hypothetical protein
MQMNSAIFDNTSTGNACMYYAMHLHSPQWQFPIGPDSLDELQHAEALEINRTQFPNVHIHWERASRDSDGGHGYYGIYWPDERFIDAESGEVNVDKFWSFYVDLMPSAYAYSGQLQIESDPYNDFDRSAKWSETTDEGSSAEELRMCTDYCKPPTNTVYDQYAQEAGY